METKKKFYCGEPDYAVSPGELLSSVLNQREIEPGWLAEKLGIEPAALRSLLRAETPVTEEIASGLERVLGVPAYFWQRAESTYRVRKRRREESSDASCNATVSARM